MRTTFFTCCNKQYEDFIPIFLHSILYHNDVDVEIGVEDTHLDINSQKSIDYIKELYPNNKIEIRIADFKPLKMNDLTYSKCPNVIRFIETPKIKNQFVYICDIDIITLQKNIQQIHIDDMNDTGLNYSNIVRPNDNIENKRLSGLHFSKWDNYYPIPNFEDIASKGLLNLDEVFLYHLVKKKNYINETHTFRPVHGIHISPNRIEPSTWGLGKWKPEWQLYRKSAEFLQLEKYFSEKILQYVKIIDEYYV